MKLLSVLFLAAFSLFSCSTMDRTVATAPIPADSEKLERFSGEIVAQGGESDAYYVMCPRRGKVELWQGSSAVLREIRANVGANMDFFGEWKKTESGRPAFVVERMQAQIPIEGTSLTGVIRSQGGESDLYFFQDSHYGTVYLQHRGAKAYTQIREMAGKKVTVHGSWNEREDQKLVFIVSRVESAR